MLAGLAIGAALALASGAVDLDAQLRTEARAYASDSVPTSDLELVPRLTLRVRDRTSSAAATYTPLLLLHPGTDTSPDGLNRFELRLETRGHRWSAQLAAQASYGQQTFTLMAPPEDPLASRLSLVPQTQSAAVLTGSVDASARYAATHTLWLELGAGYLGGGGLQANAPLPVEKTPRAFAGATQALSRVDALNLRADVEQTDVDGGAHARVAAQRAVLTHRLLPETALRLGMGLAELQTTPVDGDPTFRVAPVALAILTHDVRQADRPGTAVLAATVEPSLDRLTGEAYPRGELRAALAYQLLPKVRTGAAAALAAPVATPERQGELLALGELGATYQLRPDTELGLGARALHEQLVLPSQTEINQWGGFASLLIREAVLGP